jgi:MFS family permease
LLAKEIDMKQPLSVVLKPWLVCFAAALFFFYEFIQGNMFASIASHIMQDFQIQADKMTYLSSSFYLANVLFLFVAGIILDKISIKRTMIVALFFCVLSTFILATTQSFNIALTCRFVMGIGAAFCFLGPVRLAFSWFPPERMALVTGAIVTLAMLGGMVSQYPLTVLVGSVGWRTAVQYVGMLGIFIILVMAYFIEEKPRLSSESVSHHQGLLQSMKQVYFNPQNVCAAFYTSLMNMSIAVYGAMMGTLYLEQRLGVSVQQASLVNSLLFLGAIIGGPVIGAFSDKSGFRIGPMKAGVLISLVTLMAILYLPVTYPVMMVLFFLLGFFTSAQVISYALVAESSAPALTAMAVSVVSILTQGGYIVYQNMFTALLIHHGGVNVVDGVPLYTLDAYHYAATILPVGLLVAFLLLFALKETYCKHREI